MDSRAVDATVVSVFCSSSLFRQLWRNPLFHPVDCLFLAIKLTTLVNCCSTPTNCESCTPAALFNYYESVQYSAYQLVGDYARAHTGCTCTQPACKCNGTQSDPTKGVSYVVPYTNARGVIWDDDTAQFMDEWTEVSNLHPLRRNRGRNTYDPPSPHIGHCPHTSDTSR
jgi:hypothetical protein